MKPKLKRLSEQTIVITGASSGIGLTTARMASARGAAVLLAARNAGALRKITEEIIRGGGRAGYVVADVGNMEDVRNIAQTAVNRFGGFDTWVNNAGVSIFGRNEEIALEDMRRLFETNFWGVVHGSLVAVEHLRRRGGALINIGSEVSDFAVPLQGIYAASKHAVKAFTDSLRLELEHDGAPVSVTLVKPAATDTLFLRHAKNYMDVEPRLPPPIYAPQATAEAILYAAQHRKRDIFVGAAARLLSASTYHAPRLMDKFMQRLQFRSQRSDRPPRDRAHHALYAPGEGLQERMGYDGHVMESSLYTKIVTHPKVSATLALGAGLMAAALWRRAPDGTARRSARR